MSQITARLPDDLVKSLDAAAHEIGRPKSEIIRKAIECYLDDYMDLTIALERLRDPTDPVLDWEDAKRELLAED